VASVVAALVSTLGLINIEGDERFASSLGAGIAACFYVATAHSLWLGRSEALRGRMPLIGVTAAYAFALFMLVPQFLLSANYTPVPTVGWLGVIQFVGLAYSLGVTVFLVMMLSSRTEKLYRTAALTDALTGLLNRRAFVDRAQRVLDRNAQIRGTAALMAFDLDRFKKINDTFGHAMGDRVLRIFADVLGTTTRPTDLLARIGGEEFVALLPNAGCEAALSIANRVRETFQEAAQFVDGRRIDATVSVGIAATAGHPWTIIDILPLADAALYIAKNEGRNRVVLAPADPDPAFPSDVVELA
jgi:diguanylate cyclase (GGDEF)-like protein